MGQTERRQGPLLQGPRVLLRLGGSKDALAILEFFLENREHFKRTDPPRPAQFYTEGYWTERVVASALDYREDRSCHLFIFARSAPKTVIGYANLSSFVRGAFHACYLGYGLGAAHEGKGLMTEALELVIRLGFDELRLHRIMANYLPTNERSGRVLDKLGFTREGYARNYLFINGGWRDHILTALTNDRWEPPEK